MHDVADLDAFGVQIADDIDQIAAGPLEIILGIGPINLQGDQVRMIGEIAQQIDVFKDAMNGAAFADHQPVDIVAGHSQQGVKQEIILSHANQFITGERANRRIHRLPFDNCGLAQISGGDDAGFIAALDQK